MCTIIPYCLISKLKKKRLKSFIEKKPEMTITPDIGNPLSGPSTMFP